MNVRRAKLILASCEKSYSDICKLAWKIKEWFFKSLGYYFYSGLNFLGGTKSDNVCSKLALEAKAYGFKIETYQVRIPPKKLTCAKNKERQSNCKAIADYLLSNAQVNVKRANLNLPSSERSYKLISKSIKNE